MNTAINFFLASLIKWDYVSEHHISDEFSEKV